MHRIDGYGHKNHRFYSPDEGAIDYDGQTKLTAEWLNSVQEEVCRLLEAFDVKLDKGSEGQVAKLAKDLVAKMERKINEDISALPVALSAEISKVKQEIQSHGTAIGTLERANTDRKSEIDGHGATIGTLTELAQGVKDKLDIQEGKVERLFISIKHLLSEVQGLKK